MVPKFYTLFLELSLPGIELEVPYLLIMFTFFSVSALKRVVPFFRDLRGKERENLTERSRFLDDCVSIKGKNTKVDKFQFEGAPKKHPCTHTMFNTTALPCICRMPFLGVPRNIPARMTISDTCASTGNVNKSIMVLF